VSQKILFIEDDINVAQLVSLHLKNAGLEVRTISDGQKGLEEFKNNDFDLLIVDLMLPKLDGKEIIRQVRAYNKDIPILITSAKGDLMNKVLGFELGADDFLPKPFEIEELVARVKALLRRRTSNQQNDDNKKILQIGEIKVDLYRHQVFLLDREIELSPILYDLLVFLMKSPGRAYTRTNLINYVWQYEHEGYEHTVDTHINRLRSKIEPQPANPKYVLTVWGVGYKFAEAAEIAATK
jgi:DNA-binding response OmpR family regulator